MNLCFPAYSVIDSELLNIIYRSSLYHLSTDSVIKLSFFLFAHITLQNDSKNIPSVSRIKYQIMDI